MVSDLGLYGYLQTVQGYLAPPITAVFLLGMFSRRINSAGAVSGLVVGFTLAMAKLACQITNKQVSGLWLIGPFGAMNWLYFSLLLFGISVVTIVAVSLLTPRPLAEKISGLTYGGMTTDDRKELRASWNFFDVIVTVAILAILVGMYVYFSFGFWTT